MRTDIARHLVIILYKNKKSTVLGENKKRDSSPIGQKQEQRLYVSCQNMITVIVCTPLDQNISTEIVNHPVKLLFKNRYANLVKTNFVKIYQQRW